MNHKDQNEVLKRILGKGYCDRSPHGIREALKGDEGHHVSVTGKLDNDTLHVDKVSMLKDQKKGNEGPHGL